MSKDYGNSIYTGMVTFPSFSAFSLNLQAMIEKQLRWQITLGWFSFSIPWARSYSITIHADCCKGNHLQPCMGRHTWSRNLFPPLKKTATPKFFFQISQHLDISTASVAPTVILCVIKKYKMLDGSRVNPAHRAKQTQAENYNSGRVVCTWKSV